MSVFSAVAEFVLGKSSVLGDIGDYDDYSSMSLLGRRKLHGWSIANKSRVGKSIL